MVWAQTFGLLYGDGYKQDCLEDRKFYPYANAKIYWETFEAPEIIRLADRAGLDVILYGKGKIYKPEDGTVLHCLCRK